MVCLAIVGFLCLILLVIVLFVGFGGWFIGLICYGGWFVWIGLGFSCFGCFGCVCCFVAFRCLFRCLMIVVYFVWVGWFVV